MNKKSKLLVVAAATLLTAGVVTTAALVDFDNVINANVDNTTQIAITSKTTHLTKDGTYEYKSNRGGAVQLKLKGVVANTDSSKICSFVAGGTIENITPIQNLQSITIEGKRAPGVELSATDTEDVFKVDYGYFENAETMKGIKWSKTGVSFKSNKLTFDNNCPSFFKITVLPKKVHPSSITINYSCDNAGKHHDYVDTNPGEPEKPVEPVEPAKSDVSLRFSSNYSDSTTKLTQEKSFTEEYSIKHTFKANDQFKIGVGSDNANLSDKTTFATLPSGMEYAADGSVKVTTAGEYAITYNTTTKKGYITSGAKLAFEFETAKENGYDLTKCGTFANGGLDVKRHSIVTLKTEDQIHLQTGKPFTLQFKVNTKGTTQTRPDKFWAGGLVLTNNGAGAINIPNGNKNDGTNSFALRDKDYAKADGKNPAKGYQNAFAKDLTKVNDDNIFAMVYDGTRMSAYQNGVKMAAVPSNNWGDINKFDVTFTQLFGEHTNKFNFAGVIYHFSYTEGYVGLSNLMK